jgi:hypothetical protein
MVNLLAVKHRIAMQAVMVSWMGSGRLDTRQLIAIDHLSGDAARPLEQISIVQKCSLPRPMSS